MISLVYAIFSSVLKMAISTAMVRFLLATPAGYRYHLHQPSLYSLGVQRHRLTTADLSTGVYRLAALYPLLELRGMRFIVGNDVGEGFLLGLPAAPATDTATAAMGAPHLNRMPVVVIYQPSAAQTKLLRNLYVEQ
jgi:hypothetical protein